MRDSWATLTVIGLLAMMLVLGLRGLSGNPSSGALLQPEWRLDGPLELSPERGRFALLYSLAEDHSLTFSLSVAKLAIPDLAINSTGQYVSLFAPAVSFIAVPGYLIGKFFGAAQVGAYAVITIFAFFNFWLIRIIATRLGAEPWAGLFGALTFSIATPAFAYAGTLYQHHISVFLLLISIWLLLRFHSIVSLALVWFACSFSAVVDNPNLFLMLPVGILSVFRLGQIILATPTLSRRAIRAAFSILSAAVVILPLGFFAWYNLTAYGNPFQLPGTLQSVSEIGPDGKPVKESAYEKDALSEEQLRSQREGGIDEKSAIGFFKTRNLYNGFYIHFLSLDRGMLFFAPAIFVGIFGLALLYRSNQRFAGLILGSIGINILLYSMWGDPQGGWAFGSRYLIPTYALLAIGVAIALSRWRFRSATLMIFIPLFTYSLWVNSLGAVTSIANPPETQVLTLEKQSDREQKYTFKRNEQFLQGKIGSKTFVYQTWAKHSLTARTYHILVFGLGLGAALIVILAEFLPWQKIGNWITSRRV